ncbi:MAG: hypothetical protein K6G15_02505 [Desulfovibrio sp.]|nr:hypothetical protein [Desulfovibrio sp.]
MPAKTVDDDLCRTDSSSRCGKIARKFAKSLAENLVNIVGKESGICSYSVKNFTRALLAGKNLLSALPSLSPIKDKKNAKRS